MKKFTKILIVTISVIILGIAYYLISPLFIEKQVNETVADILQDQAIQEQSFSMKLLKSGQWIGVEGHDAQGQATLLEVNGKNYIRFEDDFTVTNGPDLFVHLGKDGEYNKNARLGLLKGNIGGQNYEIPESLNIEDFNEVWVWCRAFSVPFAVSELQPLENNN